MNFNRWLPVAIPFLSGLLMEMIYLWPNLVYVGSVMIIALQFFIARQLCLQSPKSDKWWQVFILPALFSIGQILFGILLPSPFFVQILFLGNVLFLFAYWRAVYRYLLDENRYRKLSLQNMSSYGNFTAYYFLASAVYGLQIFVSADTWILMLALLAATVLIAYQVAWANQIEARTAWPYIILCCIMLLEIAWSTSFLTLSYYILGLLMAVVYYILIGLVRLYLLGTLNAKTVRVYLISGLGSILAVLLTANWISHG